METFIQKQLFLQIPICVLHFTNYINLMISSYANKWIWGFNISFSDRLLIN